MHKPWQSVLAVTVLALAAGPAVRRANADEWNKRTVLTVNQPIEVADTVLQPGQYILLLATPNNDRHVVQVFNSDRSRLIETVLTIPTQRLQVTGKTQFAYWETPPGTAKALRDWYYPGDNFGQEFPYPKHPQQLAMLEKTESVAPPASAPVTQPTPPPAAEPQPVAEQPVPNTATETAQAGPPAQPAAPSAEQTPAPPAAPDSSADRAAPAELPKTASPYPLIGLSGIFLLGLAAFLRLKGAGARS